MEHRHEVDNSEWLRTNIFSGEVNYIYQQMDHLQKFAPTLYLLQKAPPSLKRSIIKKASPKLIHCLCDCSYNILKGNVKRTSSNKRQLNKHKIKLRQLSNKQVKKKRKIMQTEGFFLCC